MTGEITAASIPAPAWEQAVFVVLFVLFVLALLRWFTSQQTQWQRFIEKRDDQWQTFLENQRKQDNNTIQDLVGEVKRLTQELVNLRSDFDEHNTWERTALNGITKPRPGTGRKAAQ